MIQKKKDSTARKQFKFQEVISKFCRKTFLRKKLFQSTQSSLVTQLGHRKLSCIFSAINSSDKVLVYINISTNVVETYNAVAVLLLIIILRFFLSPSFGLVKEKFAGIMMSEDSG